jgi:predicted dehydrogenase
MNLSQPKTPQPSQSTSRRDFLKASAIVAGAAAVPSLAVGRTAHAAGGGTIKIGLVGCGGRGSGAAVNAMNAGKDVKLVAMADIFEEYVKGARDRIKAIKPEQTAVDDEHCFVGFDAYKKVIECADVVLIAPSSHFQPIVLKAAIDAGKHVFCEKPHGLDAPGVKASMAAAEDAKKKGLSLVSGLCWRYDVGARETMKRVQDGAIGDIIAIQENYLSSPYVMRPRKQGWSEMEYQYRNWYHFNWLSGDQTAQQLIHSLDKASWAMGDKPPVKAWGMGGRQVCTHPDYGDQFDHHAVVFEYANGVRLFGFTRDQVNCYTETEDYLLGTKGRAAICRHHIDGAAKWRFRGEKPSMYDEEHRLLFESIRSGKPLNNMDYMGTSSMLAVMAQMVCYTGQEVTWEQAMNSKLTFAQPRYGFDAEPPIKPDKDGNYPAALPGITKFI